MPPSRRADEMERARHQAPELVGIALAEEAQLLRLAGVLGIDTLQRVGVALHLEPVDERAEEAALVEKMDALRRREDVLHVARLQIVGRDPFADHRREIHQRQEDRRDHGRPVAAEAPPHQLPLAGHVVLFLLGRQRLGDVGVPRLRY